MNTFERKIAKSFGAVKRDILELKNNLLKLAERQERIETEIEDIKKKSNEKKAVKTKR